MERREIPTTQAAGEMQEEDDQLQGAVAFSGAGPSIPPNLEPRQADRMHNITIWPQNREISTTRPAGEMQEDRLEGPVAFPRAGQSIPPNLVQRHMDRMHNDITGPQGREIPETWSAGGMREEDPWQGGVARSGVGQSIPANWEKPSADRIRETSQTRPDGGMQEEDPLRGAVAFTRAGQSIPPNFEQRQVDRTSNNITGPQKREIPTTWPAGGMQEEDPLRGAVAFTRVGQSSPPSLEQTSTDRTSNNIIGPQNRETSQTRPDGGMQEEDSLRGAVAFTRAGQSIPPNLDQRQADRTSNNITGPQKREIPKTLFLGHIQEERRWRGSEAFKGVFQPNTQILDQRLTDSYKNTGLQNSDQVTAAIKTEAQDVPLELWTCKESQTEGSSKDENSNETEDPANGRINGNQKTLRSAGSEDVHLESEKVTEEAANISEAQNAAQELYKYNESQKEGPSNDENSSVIEKQANGWEKEATRRRTGKTAGKYDVCIKSPGGTRLRSKGTLLKHINSKHANVNPEDFDFVLPSHLRKRGTCKPPKDINKENEDKASTLRGIKKEHQVPPADYAGDTQNTEKDPAVLDNVSDGGSSVFHDSIAKSKGKRTIKQCFSKTAMMNEDVPRKRIRSVRKDKRPALRDEQESVRSKASFKNKPHATSKVTSQKDAVLAEKTAGPSNVLCERQQNQQESQESNMEDRRMQLQSHYQTGQAMLWPRDVFNNINQDRLIFCLSLQSMLKELNEEWERQARDDIYSYLIRCRSKNRSGFSPD